MIYQKPLLRLKGNIWPHYWHFLNEEPYTRKGRIFSLGTFVVTPCRPMHWMSFLKRMTTQLLFNKLCLKSRTNRRCVYFAWHVLQTHVLLFFSDIEWSFHNWPQFYNNNNKHPGRKNVVVKVVNAGCCGGETFHGLFTVSVLKKIESFHNWPQFLSFFLSFPHQLR